MVRVIGGTARGRKLYLPKGHPVRPTADRVKEAVFNILQAFPFPEQVLDIFAGIGSLGIEFLSRGAKQAVFIEKDRSLAAVLKKNLEHARLKDMAEVRIGDVFKEIPRLGNSGQKRFDVVVMDPPYDQGFLAKTLHLLHESGVMKQDAIVIIEHSPWEEVGQGNAAFKVFDHRSYGQTLVSFLRMEGGEGDGTNPQGSLNF